MQSYFDTVPESPANVAEFTEKALKQEEIIKSYFDRGWTGTASDMWRMCYANGYSWPLTSVRRAITNLGREWTGRVARGIYGRNERVWR